MNPRMRRFLLDAQALALPIGTYWAGVLLAMGVFTAAILVSVPWAPEMAAALAGIWVGTVGGVALGQILTILRLRAFVPLGVAASLWAVGAMLLAGPAQGLQAEGPGVVLIAGVVAVFLAPFFVASGHFSLATHGGMLATFTPLVFITATILLITEETGAVTRWHAGEKWAIWNVLTAPILGLGVVLVLVFLASRELHRLHRWRYAAAGPEIAMGVSQEGLSRGRATPGLGGLGVLLVLGVFLTVASAFVAPYLWRTGPGDHGDDGSGDARPDGEGGSDARSDEARDGQRGESGWEGGEPADGEGVGGQQMMEQARRAAQQAAFSLLMLLAMLLLALLSLLVFGPPLRRMLLLQHLRRPFWPVPPTVRVRQHWRLVEIALGDLGHQRRPGDSAESLARRAAQQVDLVDPESLVHCAEIADRVRFGLSVLPHDTMYARRTAEMTYQTVWEELTENQKFRAMYRFL